MSFENFVINNYPKAMWIAIADEAIRTKSCTMQDVLSLARRFAYELSYNDLKGTRWLALVRYIANEDAKRRQRSMLMLF